MREHLEALVRLLRENGENLWAVMVEDAMTGSPAGLDAFLASNDPFLVHAGQPHSGTTPRFLAQPPLIPNVRFELTRRDGNYSLVEQAIRLGLGERRDS
jgi:hypothetical protein